LHTGKIGTITLGMGSCKFFGLVFGIIALVISPKFAWTQTADQKIASGITNRVGTTTNGPVVFQVYQWNLGSAASTNKNFPWLSQQFPTPSSGKTVVFDHFLPASLGNALWTNLMARTNGRTTRIWSERMHPANRSSKPPLVKWDTNNLMWGMAGLTALSPAWECEGSPGQAPVTALTRRHGYARGHSMGPPGFHKLVAGKKIWFLDRDNRLVEVRILSEVNRHGDGRDYTLLLFDRDLPPSIEPLQVASFTNMLTKHPALPAAPRCQLKTEQSGHVSADLPGFTVNTWKAGDSGSPDLLPLGNQLVFTNGRSTTGPTREMQADMDELCRQAKLNPARYQMTWADLSQFPSY
jgi:hypothetical protein